MGKSSVINPRAMRFAIRFRIILAGLQIMHSDARKSALGCILNRRRGILSNAIGIRDAANACYLASMIGLDKRWLSVHGIDADRIAGLVPLSGQTITHFTIREERNIPRKQPIIDEYAPLYHIRPDAPPLILMTSDRNLEMLGRYEENAYLMRMMKVVGHEKTELYEL